MPRLLLYLPCHIKKLCIMEKIISFVSTVRSISDYSATDLTLSSDLVRALKDGFIVKDFKQIITTSGIFSSSKHHIISTFILEKEEA